MLEKFIREDFQAIQLKIITLFIEKLVIIVEYGFLDSTGDDVKQLKNDSLKYA